MPEPYSYVDHANGGEVISGMLYTPEEVSALDEAQVKAAAKDAFYIKDPDITSKQEARDAETNRYWNGNPCKNNHLSDRYLKGQCIQCFRNSVKARRKTEHGREVYQAARKRAMDRRKENRAEAEA